MEFVELFEKRSRLRRRSLFLLGEERVVQRPESFVQRSLLFVPRAERVGRWLLAFVPRPECFVQRSLLFVPRAEWVVWRSKLSVQRSKLFVPWSECFVQRMLFLVPRPEPVVQQSERRPRSSVNLEAKVL